MTFNLLKYLAALLLPLLLAAAALAQTTPKTPPPAAPGTAAPAATPAQPQPDPNRIELVQADALEGGKYKGEEIRKLLGNVVFKQNNSFLYCDSAYQYKSRNAIEAFSNVRINQADTVSVTGNRLTYNGDTRMAKMRGNVVLQDRKMTLTAPSLDYNLNTKIASYSEGGTIVDAENQINSQFGQYSTASKVFVFRNQVKINSKDGQIESQALDYNTLTKVADFFGPTRIINPQGTIYAERGTYNTVTKLANFSSRASVETPDYIMGGDVLVYDEPRGYGKATGNVRLTSKKDSVVITGQEGQHWRQRGLTKVYGNPIMRRPVGGGDSLFLAADTLMAIDAAADTAADYTIAYPNVRIYKSDLQGRCDSLAYSSKDSTLYMHFDPILWSNRNQIVADHIRLLMANKALDRMETYANSFMASEDTLHNYNQVKGRDMVAYFRESKIRRVNVNGNAESIYYALENDTSITGLNRALCSNMVLQFDSNRVKTITFLTQPDARFIPPHEFQEPDTRLTGFNWRIKEKPTKADLLTDSLPRKPRTKLGQEEAGASSPEGKEAAAGTEKEKTVPEPAGKEQQKKPKPKKKPRP